MEGAQKRGEGRGLQGSSPRMQRTAAGEALRRSCGSKNTMPSNPGESPLLCRPAMAWALTFPPHKQRVQPRAAYMPRVQIPCSSLHRNPPDSPGFPWIPLPHPRRFRRPRAR